MELIRVISQTTGLQDLIILTMIFSGIGIVFLGLFSILDWEERESTKFKIGFVVSVIIFLSGVFITDWTPRLVYYYNVKDLTQLEQYTDTHNIYNDISGLYKLIEK